MQAAAQQTECVKCRDAEKNIRSVSEVYKGDMLEVISAETYSVVDDRVGTFNFLIYRALDALRENPRQPIEVPADVVERFLIVNVVDMQHLDHIPNPDEPGILAAISLAGASDPTLPEIGIVLIDGSHRAAKCLRDGKPFKAYQLTPVESLRAQYVP